VALATSKGLFRKCRPAFRENTTNWGKAHPPSRALAHVGSLGKGAEGG
jgi:hypothetical protein